ncbi:hypothetical protein MSG28_007403 [Choristoneura fumiferana]|uniref:Uncharacterized protein n=1 Tax=Choristoneura fumiferana TaxID=7141 RepID=A0ACC0JX10_CHOFU|nr:hypothetical protein MSG28_007403 [Choristoneura fumiferana]
MNPTGSSTALSADLNSFIYGVSRRNFQNALELTKIGISLLKTFPAARDAVLEYFAMMFHSAVNVSINPTDYEADPSTTGALDSVNMIGPELCGLGEAWAPFIAPWCINLIMDIATQKENVPSGTLQTTEPIRTLLDITAQNLTLLDTDMRAKCIDMMLGCRACSWAVGWVGRAEPALVAPRALALGADAVLAQLAGHPPALLHVRAALLDLFTEAIALNGNTDKQRDVIPYLLNLASKSDIVLKAMTQDIKQTLTDEVVQRLWVVWSSQRHTAAWEGVGPATLVALLVRADVHCTLLLLQHAACRQLLEYLLQKLEFEGLLPENDFPLLASAAEEAPVLRERLLVGNQLEQYTVARLLILVCCKLPSEYVNTLSYLLQYSRDDTTLALFVRILAGTMSMHVPTETSERMLGSPERYQELVQTAVSKALGQAMVSDTQIKTIFVTGKVPEDQKTYLHHFCLNIIKLSSKLARAVALRDLLETAMFREEKAFGSKSVVANTVVTAKDWQQEDLLMHMNQKHQVSIERELYMRSALESSAVARAALRRCAGARPALCLADNVPSPALFTCDETGMAGAGKTSFTRQLSRKVVEGSRPYIINLDPACREVPYPANIDIRDTVNYKEVMKQYGLGPNGGIVTALNLFSTKFGQVVDLIEKAGQKHKYCIIDTPGQIEVFTWSASGTIITEALAASCPTVIVYVMDTVRSVSPVTFMSNMLYACSILDVLNHVYYAYPGIKDPGIVAALTQPGSGRLLKVLCDNNVLTELDFSWNNLTTGPLLKKLIQAPKLRLLDVSNNKLGELAAKALSGGLPLSPKLHTLNVSNNPMGPPEALMLLEAMKLNTVKLVNLLMADILVNREFVAKTNITHGKVIRDYTLSTPDLRFIVMNRLDFVFARANKKCKVDIALYFMEQRKIRQREDPVPLMEPRELLRFMKISGAPVDEGLIEEANMKEARILLAQEILPTMVSSSFMKLLKMLMEKSVPATDTMKS